MRYRCSAEPVENYVLKGGKAEDTVGRKCLCNALMANIGHQQTRKDGSVEPPLITVGDDLNTIVQYPAAGTGQLQRGARGGVVAELERGDGRTGGAGAGGYGLMAFCVAV